MQKALLFDANSLNVADSEIAIHLIAISTPLPDITQVPIKI